MSTTITLLNERLTMYMAAEKAILEGNQSWSSPDGMTYSRADLGRIQFQIKSLQQEISALDGTGFQAQRFVFGGRR